MEVISNCRVNGLPCLDPQELSRWASRNHISDEAWSRKATSITLTRGCEPSTAFILTSYATLQSLIGAPGSYEPIELRIVSRGRSGPEADYPGAADLTIGGWYVHRADAVLPAWSSSDSPYLVELRDARQVARLSYLNEDFNLWTPGGGELFLESVKRSGPPGSLKAWSSETMVKYIWEQMPVLGRVPSLPKTYWTIDAPQNWRFRGWSAWDAYCFVLDTFGYVIAPKGFSKRNDGSYAWSGQWSVQSELDPRAEWDTEYQEARAKAVRVPTDTNHPVSVGATRLAEEIKVIFPARRWGYQDDVDPLVVHWRDSFDSNPTHVETRKGHPFAVPGTKIAIVYPFPATFDSGNANPSLPSLIDDWIYTEIADRMAEVYLEVGEPDVYETFSGLHPLMPGPDVAHTKYFDFGSGWQTEVKNDWVGNKYVTNFMPAHTLPDPIASHTPYHRCAYVKVNGAVSGGGSTIAPGELGVGKVHWQNLSSSGNRWEPCSPPKTIQFRNVGLNDIEDDDNTWAYCEFWWQSKEFIAFCGFQEVT